MLPRGTGLIPSPPDRRDYSAESLFAAAPVPEASTSLVPFVSIRDQLGTSSCVWFSIAQAARLLFKSKGAKEELWFSPLFGYFNTRHASNQTDQDIGCIPRVAMATLMKTGFCRENEWPFDVSKVNNLPSWRAYQAAFDTRLLSGYYRIQPEGFERLTFIRQALAKGYPVIYGSPIDEDYVRYSGGVLGRPTKKSLGNHMRCLVGYEKDYFIEANSWGTNWGIRGMAHLSEEFIAWDGAFEFWVFETLPLPPLFTQ